MAEWPTVEAVKQSLGVTATAKDAVIASAVKAAIEQVAVDLGYQDITVSEDSGSGTEVGYTLTAGVFIHDADTGGEVSDPVEVVPTNSMSNAALILAVMVVKAPDAPYGIAAAFDLGAVRVASDHPTYTKMLTGQRVRFAVA